MPLAPRDRRLTDLDLLKEGLKHSVTKGRDSGSTDSLKIVQDVLTILMGEHDGQDIVGFHVHHTLFCVGLGRSVPKR